MRTCKQIYVNRIVSYEFVIFRLICSSCNNCPRNWLTWSIAALKISRCCTNSCSHFWAYSATKNTLSVHGWLEHTDCFFFLCDSNRERIWWICEWNVSFDGWDSMRNHSFPIYTCVYMYISQKYVYRSEERDNNEIEIELSIFVKYRHRRKLNLQAFQFCVEKTRNSRVNYKFGRVLKISPLLWLHRAE